MGLDQYLRAKTTSRKYKGATGACNGIFGVAPDDEGMVEIGYWRKAYDQHELIVSNIEAAHHTEPCENIPITREEVLDILEQSEKILKTHKFNKDGDDITKNCELFGTYMCKQKWEDTVEFFTEAKNILEEDSEAEIYYCSWS